MFCTTCGAAVPEGSAFCTACGSPVTQGSAASAPSSPAPSAQSQSAPSPQVAGGFSEAPGGAAPYGQVPRPSYPPVPAAQQAPAPQAYPMPQPAPAPQPAPQRPYPAQQPAPAPQAPRKRGVGKVVGIALGAIALVAALGAGGLFAYRTFIADKPEDIVAANAGTLMAAYADPSSDEGAALVTEADRVLAALGNYPHPGEDAYEAWLEDSTYEVDEVTVSEDGATATAAVTVSHRPLIDAVEAHEGARSDAGEEQDRELELTYRRSGDVWTVDDEEARAAVYAAYLPTDEELILSDVYWYLGDPGEADGRILVALQESGDQSFTALGITMDQFLEAFLDGYDYEVGAVSVDGDTATVRLTLTVKPYDGIVTEFQRRFQEWSQTVDPSTVTSEEQIYRFAGQLLLETVDETAVEERAIEIVFVQDGDGVWWMDEPSHIALMEVFGG